MDTRRSTRHSSKRSSNEVNTSPSSSPRKERPTQKRTKTSKSIDTSNKDEPKYRRVEGDSPPPTSTLKVEETIGDIFNAPPNTLIIHACNCDGAWGAGIAAAFRQSYPKAYENHKDYCDGYGPEELIKTAQLIPPVDAFEAEGPDGGTPDDELQFKIDNPYDEDASPRKHFIGCLFTSRHYGRRRDSPKQILHATAPAMVDLLRKVKQWNESAEGGEKVKEVRMCKINSGLFAVPWEKTKAVLEGIDVGRSDVKVVRVVSPAETPKKAPRSGWGRKKH